MAVGAVVADEQGEVEPQETCRVANDKVRVCDRRKQRGKDSSLAGADDAKAAGAAAGEVEPAKKPARAAGGK